MALCDFYARRRTASVCLTSNRPKQPDRTHSKQMEIYLSYLNLEKVIKISKIELLGFVTTR